MPGRAQQTPAAQPQTPAATPAPAADADDRDHGDGQFSVGLLYWFSPDSRPKLRTGEQHTQEDPAYLDFPGKAKPAPGVMLSLPAKGLNSLRISYFQTRGQGNTVADRNLALFAVGYVPGDYLSAAYKIQSAKVSFEYHSWPFPVKDSKFRVKTLWEFQYVNVKAEVDAPLKPYEDEEGNAITTFGEGTRWFLLPSVGLGAQYLASKHFRIEAKGSGFALPRRAAVWDAEAMGAYRFGQWEIQFGYRGFHFKTSPKQEDFIRGTLSGGFVGLRWYP